MQAIKGLLEKFQKILKNDQNLKNQIIKKVKEEAGIDLDSSKIKIKEKTAFIQENPVIKSEIFLRKEKILSTLGGQIKDLR